MPFAFNSNKTYWMVFSGKSHPRTELGEKSIGGLCFPPPSPLFTLRTLYHVVTTCCLISPPARAGDQRPSPGSRTIRNENPGAAGIHGPPMNATAHRARVQGRGQRGSDAAARSFPQLKRAREGEIGEGDKGKEKLR